MDFAAAPPAYDDDPIAAARGLIAAGRAGEAALALRARLAAGRGGLLARLTLIEALLAAGDSEAGLAEARETVLLHPGVAPAIVALGDALLAAQNLPAAIGEFQRALRIDPSLSHARRQMGIAWLDAGEAQQALDIFEALQADEALDLAAEIARARAILGRPRSDAGYVRHLFDQFSADYDTRMLGSLGYAAPQILAELADLVLPGRHDLAVLDLGCGTGLAGLAFRGRAARLDGVDLSPAMIAKARARGIYDALAVADLESALAENGAAYDLMIAADTLVYLGDLGVAFRGAQRRLMAGGFFLFTLEAQGTLESKDGAGFSLGPKRRWRHSQAYVRTCAADAGFGVAGLVEASPRREAGEAVPGLAVALVK